ncbi:hypothetical protein AVEN_235745-1 [Araneus ventricosus]|uniref:Uncharacterized protein n=1 Tax=Araneus ventricosus TaxID=182803 RepID=A0A4Y2Q9S1_ARAVE|nr:hypothetical protein AVEN_235745-1 [Araneus ventricosus]
MTTHRIMRYNLHMFPYKIQTRQSLSVNAIDALYDFRTLCCSLWMRESRGGLVVRSRPRDRRVAGSKSDSTEDPPCVGPAAR